MYAYGALGQSAMQTKHTISLILFPFWRIQTQELNAFSYPYFSFFLSPRWQTEGKQKVTGDLPNIKETAGKPRSSQPNKPSKVWGSKQSRCGCGPFSTEQHTIKGPPHNAGAPRSPLAASTEDLGVGGRRERRGCVRIRTERKAGAGARRRGRGRGGKSPLPSTHVHAWRKRMMHAWAGAIGAQVGGLTIKNPPPSLRIPL